MTIRKALVQLLFSAFFALVALVVEFLFAGFLSRFGFEWPARLLLDPGEHFYQFLLAQGFYPYSSNLFVGTVFALKLDWLVDFLFFVWLFFLFPDLPKKWIPLNVGPKRSERQYFWMK